MISDSFSMTGFAISENRNYASGSIFGIIGMIIFIGGVLMLTHGVYAYRQHRPGFRGTDSLRHHNEEAERAAIQSYIEENQVKKS